MDVWFMDKFLSILDDYRQTFKDCPSEFMSMTENVVKIQKFLEDIKKKDHGMKTLDHFTNEMEELMYDLEDITADYSCMGILQRHEVGKNLKEVNKKIGTTMQSMENFLSIASQNNNPIIRRRPCDPINDVDKIIGLGDAISKIKKWIMKEDQDREVHYNCIGLVGKGGSGKTTLAQMILEDEDIKEYFHPIEKECFLLKKIKKYFLSYDDKIMFVTVSQPVDVKTIMKDMLTKLDVKIGENERNMSSKIYENLKGSRYFLILDDVWKLDGDWWGTIKTALPQHSENCILITSRNARIVQQMGVVGKERIHVPEPLGDEDGWTLFCKNISTGDVSKNPNLREIGMEIVRKCGGLPLAIKVMGGVVSSNKISASIWMEIRDSFKQYISKNENENDSEVMSSLELSYDDLPCHLQQCLLCFALFPEGFIIEKDKMIRWWMGERFVPLKNDSLVESAERCFENLVNRSLIEVVEGGYNGKVFTCKLHDLVRDMLIKKEGSKGFFEIGAVGREMFRRLVLDGDISDNEISVSDKSKLRAIIMWSRANISIPDVVTKEFLSEIVDGYKNLRVLDLSNRISEFQDKPMLTVQHVVHVKKSNKKSKKILTKFRSIMNCERFPKFLRVLCLSLHDFEELPDFITKLEHLIWLDVSGCSHLKYLPKGLGNVSTLQVLKGFIPSPFPKKGCRFEELRKLTQLVTLEMEIKSADQLSDPELDALSELDSLRNLTILCTGTSTSVFQKLDNLVLPKHLGEVNLAGFPGERTPSWLNKEDLPSLQCLSLHGGSISSFHEKFSQSKNWKINHWQLDDLPNLRSNLNVVLVPDRFPDLKTIYSSKRSSTHSTTRDLRNFFDKKNYKLNV